MFKGYNVKKILFCLAILISSSVFSADDKQSRNCFYGGWPSQMSGEICMHPETHGDINWAKEQKCTSPYNNKERSCNDLIDTTYNICGRENLFRCNALIFGKDKKGRGKCIDISTQPKSIEKACLEATRNAAGFNRQSKFIKNNNSLLNAYIENIEKFCTKANTTNPKHGNIESCNALKDRFREIVSSAALDKYIGTTWSLVDDWEILDIEVRFVAPDENIESTVLIYHNGVIANRIGEVEYIAKDEAQDIMRFKELHTGKSIPGVYVAGENCLLFPDTAAPFECLKIKK